MEKSVFATRLDNCYNELKWLYCELYQNDREAMLRFANAAAYLVTTRKGAIRSMPERSEVEALLAAN